MRPRARGPQFWSPSAGGKKNRGTTVAPHSVFGTKKACESPQRASQTTINMQISARTLLQTRCNVLFNLSGFNLFLTEQPSQTEIQLFVRESSAHLLEFFAGQCAFFVECGPNATCDLAGFDSQHKRISFRIKESDAKMRPFCRFDKLKRDKTTESECNLEKLATKGNITKAKTAYHTRKTLYSPMPSRRRRCTARKNGDEARANGRNGVPGARQKAKVRERLCRSGVFF